MSNFNTTKYFLHCSFWVEAGTECCSASNIELTTAGALLVLYHAWRALEMGGGTRGVGVGGHWVSVDEQHQVPCLDLPQQVGAQFPQS